MDGTEGVLYEVYGARRRLGLSRRSGTGDGPVSCPGACPMSRSSARASAAAALALVRGHEGHDRASGPGPGGTARAVQVVLGVGGQVVVDDAGDVVDMYAPGGHVGGDQGPDLAGPERGQRAVPLRLAVPTVDGGYGQAAVAELAGEAVGAVLGADEDDRRTSRPSPLRRRRRHARRRPRLRNRCVARPTSSTVETTSWRTGWRW